MNNYSLFLNMNESEIESLMLCFNSDEKNYQKGDIIMSFGEKSEAVGVVEKGLAYLVGINHEGEKSIMEYYEAGDIFAKEFSPNMNENLYYIIAKTKCTIKFCNYNKIIECCHNNCQKHIKFINNLILTSIRKAQLHINVLLQRTIRCKLLTYFGYIKEQAGSNKIQIPLSLSDLADYLSVDRSAMMRELKKMNEEKIIISKGQKITVLTGKTKSL